MAEHRMLMLSDREESELSRHEQESAAAQVLQAVGSFLRQADERLEDLDQEDILGTAIYRGSQDLAEAIGSLADDLERQSEQEQRALANACLRDVQAHSLYLQENEPSMQFLSDASSEELANMNEHQFVQVIKATGTFLRDVEASLRAVDKSEAEEVADVALTVARLFVASLQSMHAQLNPQDLIQATTSNRSFPASSVRIEMIQEEGEEVENDKKEDRKFRTQSTRAVSQRRHKQRQDRLRVLWPSLGPEVQKACQWGTQAATEQPLLAVALGFTLWPAAVFSAFVGTPVLVADKLLQDVYNHFQEGPLIQTLERGAAQIYHSGRLALVSGKLVGRQSLRIVQRQVERNGGIPHIAQNCVTFALDRVAHPVETVCTVWGGICWTTDRVRETIGRFTDGECQPVAQELQQ